MEDMKLGLVESHFADIVWENEPIHSRELVKLCEKYNLPTHIDNLDKMIGAASHDKKRSGNKISIVLVKEMGDSYYEKVDVTLLSEISKG